MIYSLIIGGVLAVVNIGSLILFAKIKMPSAVWLILQLFEVVSLAMVCIEALI